MALAMNKSAAMMKKTLAILLMVGGCAPAAIDNLSSTQDAPTWEEFLATTYQENWEGGHYIVDGDMAIPDQKKLYEFWESMQQGELIVNTSGGQDTKWTDTQKVNLTYCVSNTFGSHKADIVAAMTAATDNGWEVRANVNFIYVPAQDASCTKSNSNVVFDVSQVSGQDYLARSFFPNDARSSRELLVDTSSFGDTGGWPLAHILGHELGHILGFRHEHTRPEAGGVCFEDNNWRPLTPYDSSSIMHYPQCNGTSQDLNWTAKDAQGAAALYGPPGGGTGGGTTTPPPATGTAQTQTFSGSVAKSANKQYGPISVLAGTNFTATMTGTGDADLYVRWGSAPTTTAYNCRPYLDGSAETCTLQVPAGQTKAYIMARGYAASTFSIAVAYTAP
ncbi:MAG TPA: M57 family metalloprotease [Kofleriaceae bacterium]